MLGCKRPTTRDPGVRGFLFDSGGLVGNGDGNGDGDETGGMATRTPHPPTRNPSLLRVGVNVQRTTCNVQRTARCYPPPVTARPAPAAGERAGAPAARGEAPRRRSLVSILAASLLLVALVPFLPLTLLTWSAYHHEVTLVEAEIRSSNRHIAVIAGNYLDTLLRQIAEEARVAGELLHDTLPPSLMGVGWELVSADGTVLASALDPARQGRPCGYCPVLRDAAGLTEVGPWIEGASPTVLYLGPQTEAGRLVAVLDPAVLHEQLQGWTREAVDRHLYVVDGSGRLLFYSDLELSRRGADLSANPPIRRFLAGEDGDARYVSIVSGKERLGYVHRLAEADWGVVVSADAGTRLLGLRGRYQLLGWSIGFALAAAVAILLLGSRWLTRPLLDIRRALQDPDRAPQAPLRVDAATRRVVEYDDLVAAFDELGAEFAAVERELVQAEKASLLGQLASGLAHEMGTPLNVITGNAQYMLRKAAAADARRPMLEQIVSQAQRIAAMIRRLLDVSRPAEARLVAVDVAAVVRQTLDIVPGVSRGVEVRCDLDDEAGPVLADPKLLEHALMNLVVNACQAMPAGGRLAVVTGVETPSGPTADPSVVVMVVDTGCGIPPEHLPQDLRAVLHHQAPPRGHRSRARDRRPHRPPARWARRGGQHAGPRYRGAAQAEAGAASWIGAAPEPAGGTMTQPDNPTEAPVWILVAEDDAEMRELLERVLTDEGYQVLTARDGNEAVLRIEEGDFDLVLSDVRMPGPDGMEVLRRAMAHRLDQPVILMTAFGSISSAVEAMRAGAYHYLTKPFNLDDLLEIVHEAATQIRQLRSIRADGGDEAFPIVFRSPSMARLLAMASDVAASSASVLITGASGTGKELLARAIHAISAPSAQPVRAGRLRRHPRGPARKRAVRSSPRRVHRRGHRQGGHRRGGRRRHPVPRRGRQPAGVDAGQAAALSPGPTVSPGRRDCRTVGRRAAAVGEQP